MLPIRTLLSSDKDQKNTAILFASLCVTAFIFYDVIFSSDIFADRDILLVYIPMFQYWKERILSGEFPDWYPYDALGQPFVGNLFSTAFHPTKLLFLFMPAGMAMKWSILACYPLAFSGFFLLLRQLGIGRHAGLVGALLYAFNGYSISMTNNFSYLLGISTIPWAYFFTALVFQKATIARFCAAASAYSLILFGGEPQTFILACASGFLVFFLLQEKQKGIFQSFGVYCLLMAATALATAVQWVPALHLMSQANAGATGNDFKATIWSLHPLRCLELLFGGLTGESFLATRFFGRHIYKYFFNDFWARSVFFGIPGVLLCIIAIFQKRRLTKILGLFALTCLLLACGKYLGLYELLRAIPLWRPFRYPEKLIAFLMLCLSGLAAAGFDEIENSRHIKFRHIFILSSGAIVCALFLASENFFSMWSNLILNLFSDIPIPQEISSEIHASSLFFQSCTLPGLLVFIFFIYKSKEKSFYFIFPFLAILLFIGTRNIYRPAIQELSETQIQPISIIQKNTANGDDSPRFMSISAALNIGILNEHIELENEIKRMISMFLLGGNYPARFGLESMGIYLPGASARYRSLMERMSQQMAWERFAGMYSGQFISIFGKEYADYGGTTDRILYEHPFLASLIVRNEASMPRAYLSRPICAPSTEDSFKMVLSGQYDYKNFTVIECPDKTDLALPTPDGALGAAAILSRQPERVVIEVDALQRALLVLTDAYYTGWRATIDGEPVEILPANHAVRGVMIPEGKHVVEFKYRTPGLIPAAIASISTLFLGIVLSLASWLRKRPRQRAPSESDIALNDIKGAAA